MSDTTAPAAPTAAAQVVAQAAPASQAELQSQYIAIWKTAVETQMHFNEMSAKSRQLGLAFVAAALGVSVVLLSRNEDFSLDIFGYGNIHVSVLLLIAAALALYAVSRLDLDVYHKMLRGAVAFGDDFEEQYMKQIFSLDKGMTQAISWFSRYGNASLDKQHRPFKYIGTSEETAEVKIRGFYRTSIYSLAGAALVLFVAHDLKSWMPNLDITAPTASECVAAAEEDAVSETEVRSKPQTE